MKKLRNPDASQVHAPLGGYSHQVEITGPQRWLVLAGQVGMRPDGQVPEDPVDQLAVALANIRHHLMASDMDVPDIIKLTTYLVGTMDADRRRAVLTDWLAGHQPAMTLLYVAGLATPAYRVEIDVTACRDHPESG